MPEYDACPCFRDHYGHGDHCCLRDLDIDQITTGMPLPCGHHYAEEGAS